MATKEHWRFVALFNDGTSKTVDVQYDPDRQHSPLYAAERDLTTKSDLLIGIRLADGTTRVFKNRWGTHGQVQ